MKLKEDQEAGKDVRLNLENVRRMVADLEGRLDSRKKELQSMRHVVNSDRNVGNLVTTCFAGMSRPAECIQRLEKERADEIRLKSPCLGPLHLFLHGEDTLRAHGFLRQGVTVEQRLQMVTVQSLVDFLRNGTPVVLGGALVVPAGLMRTRRGDEPVDAGAATFTSDAAARARIERAAMDAVRRAEEGRGCRVVDVSADKCGWDLTSYPPPVDDKQPEPRHIEVKGRVKGAGTVCVTRNEMLYAFNQGDKFVLAIVLVGEGDDVEGPHYVRNPFDREPGWGVASINYNLGDLLARAEAH